MRVMGIVRTIDELGRMVVPKEMRKQLDIHNGDPVEITVEGDAIMMRKYQVGCLFCGSEYDLHAFKGKKICGECLRALRETKD